MDMHVPLTVSYYLSSLPLLLQRPPVSSDSTLDPNQASQLVWVGPELWIVHSRTWCPGLQRLPEVSCSEHGNVQGPAQCWLGFASLALRGRHPMPPPQWSGRTLLSRRSWGWSDKLVKCSHKRRARLLAGTGCGECRAAHLLGSAFSTRASLFRACQYLRTALHFSDCLYGLLSRVKGVSAPKGRNLLKMRMDGDGDPRHKLGAMFQKKSDPTLKDNHLQG